MINIKQELTLIVFRHMLQQHKDEPLTLELSDRLMAAAKQHADHNIRYLR